MKYRNILIDQLKIAPYFTKRMICQMSEQFSLKKGTVDAYISRSLARKDIIRLKRGMYVTTDFYEKHKTDIAYSFLLANVLRQPSYVSSWTALQYYDLVTEAIYTTISITPKVTRKYENKLGNYAYHSIKTDLFFGYVLIKSNFDFFIASPWKALFDLVYLKTNQLRGVRFNQIQGILEELRIDIENMDKKEKEIFYKVIKEHI